MKHIPMFGAMFLGMEKIYDAIQRATPGVTVSFHQVLLFLMESGVVIETAKLAIEIVQNVVALFQCLGAYLLNHLSVLAGKGVPWESDWHCCSAGLLEELRTHRKASAQEEVNRQLRTKQREERMAAKAADVQGFREEYEAANKSRKTPPAFLTRPE